MTTIDINGNLQKNKIKNFQPELCYEGDGEWTDLVTKKSLISKRFENISEFNKFKKSFKDKALYDGSDSRDEIYNDIAPEYQLIRKHFKDQIDTDPVIWYFDIETDTYDDGSFVSPFEADVHITLMQVKEYPSGKIYIWGHQMDYKPKRDDVQYIYCEDEKSMLESFIEIYHNSNVSVMTAHFGDVYDFPYIMHRMKHLGLKEKLWSYFGKNEKHRIIYQSEKVEILKPIDCYWVDFLEVYKKINPGGRESWSLDYLASYEDVGGKLNWKVEGFKSMKNFIRGEYSPKYDKEQTGNLFKIYSALEKNPDNIKLQQAMRQECFNVFVEYGIQDVISLHDIDQKKKMIKTLFNMSQTMKCNLYDTFGTIRPWSNFIYNELYDSKVAIQSKRSGEHRSFEGGFVSAEKGRHEWVISEDLTSLYPSIMIQLNTSPETFILNENLPEDLLEAISEFQYKDGHDEIYMNLSDSKKEHIRSLLEKYNYSMSVNGAVFDRTYQGIIPELVDRIFKERKEAKNKMFEARQKISNITDELSKRGIS